MLNVNVVAGQRMTPDMKFSLSLFFSNADTVKMCYDTLPQPIFLLGERFAHAHHTAPRGNLGTNIRPLLEA